MTEPTTGTTSAAPAAGTARETVRFGVVGAASRIARNAVIPALLASPKCALVHVASDGRVAAPVEGAPDVRRSSSYADVVDDPDVDAVYIPLPNHLHLPWAKRAAAAGKHVLCEKPLGSTAAEARAMAEACSAAGVVLMEAYMTPFHPRTSGLLDVVRAGRLGALRHVHTEFTFPLVAGDHRWHAEYGGGSLLDVGIYCIAPAVAFAGGRAPRAITASAVMRSGVDATFSGWLDLGDGFTASFLTSFEAPDRQRLDVVGTEGRVSLDPAFIPGAGEDGFEIVRPDGSVERVATGGGNCYRGMVDHFATVVRGGVAVRRPPAMSIALLELEDQLRAVATTR